MHVMPPLLSLVIPTRNEADNVAPLYRRLQQSLDGVDFEICFVDDSDDSTTQKLMALEKEMPGRVLVLFREASERDGGLSTAVTTGVHLARGQYICVMDADLQHPPEQIPKMLAEARAGADLVIASRYIKGGSSTGLAGWGRRFVSRSAGALARLLFSEARRSTDPLSGFFLCRRSIIDGIEFRPVGFKILLELLVCVPGINVRDVPLEFQAREHGASKASMRQGLMYLRHLISLIFEVEGSARFWKFGVVGFSGLCIFLGLLYVTVTAGITPALAVLPAFVVSFIWNTSINRIWTFADQRNQRGERTRAYLAWSLLSGVLLYVIFYLLLTLHLHPMLAGLLAAVTAMIINGVGALRSIHGSRAEWSRLATDQDVRAAMLRLAQSVNADRAFITPTDLAASATGVPAELIQRVASQRHAAIWTEMPSHRPQRRTNIENRSMLLIPVVFNDQCIAAVVCERRSENSFQTADLEAAMHAVEQLSTLIAQGSAPSPQSAAETTAP